MASLGPVRWLQETLPEAALLALEAVTHAGSGPVYGLAAGVLVLAWDRRRGYVLAAALLLGAGVNAGLKDAFRWPRPPEALRRVEPGGWGFPSGHAQTNAVFWGTLARLHRRRWVWGLGAVAVVLVSLSRVALGVHFVRDVVAGVAVGLILVGVVAAGETLLAPRLAQAGPRTRMAAAVVGPLPLAFAGIDGWAPAAAGALSGLGAALVVEAEAVEAPPTGWVPAAVGVAAGGLVAAAAWALPPGPTVEGLGGFLAAAAGVAAGSWAGRRRRAGG